MATTRLLGAADDERMTTGVAAQWALPANDAPVANGPAWVVSDQASEPPNPAQLRRTQVMRLAGQGWTDGAGWRKRARASNMHELIDSRSIATIERVRERSPRC